MIKVLIVDDERTTREILMDNIPWHTLGVTHIDTARNGIEALEKMADGGTDILISDVRMPKMDGMRLSTEVRQRWPECEIIFLSGYSDKEYLKTAIRVQAEGYLEKPVNLSEVSASVEAAVHTVMEKKTVRETSARAARIIEDAAPLVRQNLAHTLVNDAWTREEIEKRYGTLAADCFCSGDVRMALVELIWNLEYPAASRHGKLTGLLRQLNADPIGNRCMIAGYMDPGHFCFIADRYATADIHWFNARVSETTRLLEREIAGTANYRIGVAPPGLSMKAGIDAAGAAVAQAFYRPLEGIYYFREQRDRRFRIDERLLSDCRSALAAGNLDRLNQFLNNLERHARGLEDEQPINVKQEYRRVVSLLVEFAPGFNPAETKIEADKLQAAVMGAATLDELSRVVVNAIDGYFGGGEHRSSSRKVERAKQFVKDFYADPDLTVEQVAIYLGLSESYFCTIFKQGSGLTVKDYITRTRVEKAKEILRSGPDKLQKIASETGYRDTNYFCTVFKREVGMTPGEYRARSQI